MSITMRCVRPAPPCRTEEQREHDDLQNLVARHRVDDAGRNGVRDEGLQRQSVRLHGPRRRPLPAAVSCIALPGSSQVASISPSVREMTDAKMNQPSALPPIRPTVAISPIFAMPTTSVENTSGAMIILISRRKMVGRSEAISANARGRIRKRRMRRIAHGNAEHEAEQDQLCQTSGRHGAPITSALLITKRLKKASPSACRLRDRGFRCAPNKNILRRPAIRQRAAARRIQCDTRRTT